jgi:hypothetical protein
MKKLTLKKIKKKLTMVHWQLINFFLVCITLFLLFTGNWAEAKLVSEISGPVALEFGSQTYVTAMDNGLFTLGPPHNEG